MTITNAYTAARTATPTPTPTTTLPVTGTGTGRNHQSTSAPSPTPEQRRVLPGAVLGAVLLGAGGYVLSSRLRR